MLWCLQNLCLKNFGFGGFGRPAKWQPPPPLRCSPARKYRIRSLKSPNNNSSTDRRVRDRRHIRRHTFDRLDPTHRQRNTGAIATENFKKSGLTVTSVYRATKRLKPQPHRFQAVYRLQRRRTAARIHLFRLSVCYGVREVNSLHFPRKSVFSLSGYIKVKTADNGVLKTHTSCTTSLWKCSDP